MDAVVKGSVARLRPKLMTVATTVLGLLPIMFATGSGMDITKPIAPSALQRVGWFGLNNINCGLLGMPLGFLVIYVVSQFTKEPGREMQAFIDEIRKPRGGTVLQEKT